MPTRNRPERLGQTIEHLGRLTINTPAELVVADNASDEPVTLPEVLPNGITCRVVRLERNAGAAARNAAVDAACADAEWIVMLDDDSHPVERVEPFAATIERLDAQPDTVAAVMADIHLPALGCRESGGLPEVFVGCGVAIRRGAFVAAGGYDASFGYYVEEYDLAARFLSHGWSVAFEPAFCVEHHKISIGRDMDQILSRLVRNNGWVMQRYAPLPLRREMLREQRRRYRQIAEKERARAGYARGLVELRQTLHQQPRTPLLRATWDRFTGFGHVRAALNLAWRERPFASAAIVERGKNAWAVERALAEIVHEAGVSITDPDSAEVLVVGTLSPGPMLDALERWQRVGRRVVAPWRDAQPVDRRSARAA
ncbi:MAG: glycosyltransferase [Planctomycetota bacterium]|nr:glycosyltransferase [Planctomycetota bacterium]